MAVGPSARLGLPKIFLPCLAPLSPSCNIGELVTIPSKLCQVGRVDAAAQFLCAQGYSRAPQTIVRRPKSIGCDQSATTYKKSTRWRIYCLSVTPRRISFHNVISIRVETSTERVGRIPNPFAIYS